MTLNSLNSTQVAPAYTGGDVAVAVHAHAPAPASAASSRPAPAPAPAAGPGTHAVVDDAELEKIMEEPIKQANRALQPFSRQIEREIHSVTKALMYTIRDTETKEVIAEYPPKKIQDMIAKMWELAGLFIDQKA
jgi:hypothetical protein